MPSSHPAKPETPRTAPPPPAVLQPVHRRSLFPPPSDQPRSAHVPHSRRTPGCLSNERKHPVTTMKHLARRCLCGHTHPNSPGCAEARCGCTGFHPDDTTAALWSNRPSNSPAATPSAGGSAQSAPTPTKPPPHKTVAGYAPASRPRPYHLICEQPALHELDDARRLAERTVDAPASGDEWVNTDINQLEMARLLGATRTTWMGRIGRLLKSVIEARRAGPRPRAVA